MTTAERNRESTGHQGDRGAGRGPGAGRRPGGRGRRFFPRRKVCSFCVDHIEHIDYKNVDGLKRFLSERGKIEARRKTGTCARHQRMLASALKRARHLALLPHTLQHVLESGIEVGHIRLPYRGADRRAPPGP